GARLGREAALIALAEYKEGHFVQDLATAEGSIKLAESKRARAADCVDWARKMFDKGYLSITQKVAEELALQQAVFALELAQSQRKLLIDYTKNKSIKTLRAGVETARAQELAREATLQRERSLLRKLGEQIRRCKVVAPDGGRVHYATPIG